MNQDIARRALMEAVKEFDFEKVHTAMEAVGWTWFDTPAIGDSPTVGHLMAECMNLFDLAFKSGVPHYDADGTISIGTGSGGFQIRIYERFDELKRLVSNVTIEFTMEDAEGEAHE